MALHSSNMEQEDPLSHHSRGKTEEKLATKNTAKQRIKFTRLIFLGGEINKEKYTNQPFHIIVTEIC